MRSLCSGFDVKKQGKPVWEVRTRYWKLREGENRLSVLLEGIPITSLVVARRQEDQVLNHMFKHVYELHVDGCISMLDSILVGSQFYAFLVSSTGTGMVVSIPDSSLESVYRYCHMGTGTVRE
ncbi:hypothetical protein V6N12_038553 [Hibiscus sabdariffa]|uniref:Uncharacterized protein n=1 Tax=Hibiscus sabdariffa TaxID=183260 RepID=A0ABR2B6D0_9ROSI